MQRSLRVLRTLLGTAATAAGLGSPLMAQDARPWMDPNLPPGRRAELLVGAMTLPEKIQQLSMNGVANADLPDCGVRRDSRHVEGIPRLGIPTIRMTNGPIGVSGGDCAPDRTATGVPTALAVAATWDPSLAYAWGDIAGREVRANAHHVFLAPGVNLARIPNNGRNFEYFGEDPFLSGMLAVEQVRAVQRHGIQATPKHYVANEQETARQTMNTVVDDRTLHELYLLPFEMALKDTEAAAVMCSYPKINGTFACESPVLLDTLLRKQLGFSGYVMSDRGATHSTAAAIKAGLDLEFGSTPIWYTREKIDAALAAGEIVAADVDTLLKRRFTPMFRLGQFDKPITGVTPVDFQAHGQTARNIAEQSVVLLKNANRILPLDARSLRSVALIGSKTFAGAAKFPATGPGGILQVKAPYTVTPVKGLQNALAALGSSASVTYDDATDLASAVSRAAAADVAIVMAGDISLEGVDRENLSLPASDGVKQEDLIRAIAAANPRTVVVLKDGGPVLMPWLDLVPAVLEAWYPGQEDGNAVANVLFGIANPSGKLPLTFPRQEREAAASTEEQWPGVLVGEVRTATYSEGLQVGYRWYDANRKEPLFPFGYGLSYTSFAYASFKVTPQAVGSTTRYRATFTVRNSGDRYGGDVPQVYVGFGPSHGEPPKRLVGFQKVWLQPGQEKEITIVIDPTASHHPLSLWDPVAKEWRLIQGPATVTLARSARDVEASVGVQVGGPARR